MDKYKHIVEETDIEAVNIKIGINGGFDLIDTRKERVLISENEFREEITYILGKKYQDEDFFG